MTTLDNIIQISIQQNTQAIPQVGFGIPLILGDSNVLGSDLIRYYASASEMLDDGWASDDPEYIHAVAAFSQALSPTLVGIGRRDGGTMAEDIAAIQAVSGGNNWYGLVLTSKVKQDILDAAAYIETQNKIYIACSADADVAESGTGDVMSALKAFGYKRTGLIFTKDTENADLGPDSAWVGGQLPQTPGASTWKFKQLAGIAPDNYTSTERLTLIGNPLADVVGKNANIYEPVGGVNITEEGWMAGGQFIDLTVGLDWLTATMQTNIYALLVQNAKIPFTDAGGAVIQNAVLQTLRQGVANGLIDGGSDLFCEVPKVLDIPAADRAARILQTVTFECRLAGAFHFVKIVGTVTV